MLKAEGGGRKAEGGMKQLRITGPKILINRIYCRDRSRPVRGKIDNKHGRKNGCRDRACPVSVMLLCDTLKSQQIIDNHGITNHKIEFTAIVGAGLVPALFQSGVMN